MTTMVNSLPTDFSARWLAWYEGAPPIAAIMRDEVPHRWLRIHSLPGGKRYPDSGREYAELRRRHQTVASDVLGEDACAMLLQTECTSTRTSQLNQIGLSDLYFGPFIELSGPPWVGADGLFDEPVCVLAAPIAGWRSERFASFIDAVAADRAEGMFASLASGQVYAPYDGGADLFYANEFARDRAAERFTKWRSTRDDGL